jgi:enamine deaminase RidA (YjgF/YER057c/UK114 family)
MSKTMGRGTRVLAGVILAGLGSLVAMAASGAEAVERLPLPDNNDFPISAAVSVAAGTETYYLSGAVPEVVDKSASPESVQAYGSMEAQATSVLTQLQKTLGRLGLTMGDVVKMTVFMVADPVTHKVDFSGLMAGYKKFFATPEQPNKPARTAVAVASLARPGPLLEIEVVAAKAKAKAKPAAK